MDWQAVLQNTLGAGLGTVLVQVIAPWWRDKRARHAQARYLALRLAVTLEEFGAACSERNSENANAHHRVEERHPDWNASIPELPAVPDDTAGWLALSTVDSGLANRALTFRSQLAEATSTIANCAEFNEDDKDIAMNIQISECGLRAARLAGDLRSKFNLGKADPIFDWSNSLGMTLEKWREEDKRRREVNKWSPFDEGTP